MAAKRAFDTAIERAEHLLRLYDLLCDTRERKVRSTWSRKFKEFMHWPVGQKISRVDGQHTMLILREASGITRAHFAHDYLSEVLRASVVASVSAIDRYFHDVIVENSWKLLTRKEEDVPKKLRRLGISALDARKAAERLRKNSNARPGTLIKKAVQNELHDSYTFQGPNQVKKAADLLGLKDFWGEVATEMNVASSGEVVDGLKAMVKRRNQIVHEADLVRKSKGAPNLRDIDRDTVEGWVVWTKDFIHAVSRVVDAQL